MIRRWRWISIAGILTAALFIMLLAFKPWEGQARTLTEDAIKRTLLAQYPGKVNESIKKGNRYRLELETEQGIYEIEVSANDGEVLALHQLKSLGNNNEVSQPSPTAVTPTATPKPTEPAATNNPEEASPSPTPKPTHKPTASPVATAKPSSKPSNQTKLLDEKKAGKLAAAHVKGKVKDIDFKKSKNGTSYYLVEVDVKKRGDAIVQVNAISGAIMSVVWEDEDDDDDND